MPTEILPDLWIGNRHDVNNTEFLKNNNIRCIINATKDLEFNPNYVECDMLRILVDDSKDSNAITENENLYEYIPKTVNHIHEELAKNRGVLVFCYAGKQRSASIVGAYLMKYGKMSKEKVVECIKSKRPKCFHPKINFYMALRKYEDELKY